MKEKEKKTGVAGENREAGNNERGYMHQVALLVEKFPELKGKTIPEEVVQAAMSGKPLRPDRSKPQSPAPALYSNA